MRRTVKGALLWLGLVIGLGLSFLYYNGTILTWSRRYRSKMEGVF